MRNWKIFNSQAVFAREQDKLEMIRILHAARVEAGDGKNLDLELLLNLIGGIFKPDEGATENDESLQAALSAQVRKSNYENRGMAVHDPNVPKKTQDTRSPKQLMSDFSKPMLTSDFSKPMQMVFDMKAKMGCMHRAMTNACICFWCSFDLLI